MPRKIRLVILLWKPETVASADDGGGRSEGACGRYDTGAASFGQRRRRRRKRRRRRMRKRTEVVTVSFFFSDII